MFNEVFFSNFFECSMFIKSFEGYSIQANTSCSKWQLSANVSLLMKRKNLSLDEEMKVVDCANKYSKIKNGMLVGCKTNQYWKELRLTYLKERKSSSK